MLAAKRPFNATKPLEYGEAAYGAALVGAPFGIAGRTMGRPGARAEFEALQQQKMMTETPAPAEEIDTNITQMPGGYSVKREEIMGGMVPQTFNITMPGADKPLASVDTEDEAQKKRQGNPNEGDTEPEGLSSGRGCSETDGKGQAGRHGAKVPRSFRRSCAVTSAGWH